MKVHNGLCSASLVFISVTYFKSKAMPTSNTYYDCHINHVQLVYNQSYGVHIMPVHTTINRLGGRNTI